MSKMKGARINSHLNKAVTKPGMESIKTGSRTKSRSSKEQIQRVKELGTS
jgi:hypothetical protein